MSLENILNKPKPKSRFKRILAIGLLGGALTLGLADLGLRLYNFIKRDYEIRLTHNDNSEPSVCFVGDNRVVYTSRYGPSYDYDIFGRVTEHGDPSPNITQLRMVELKNNKATKPKVIFDAEDWRDKTTNYIHNILDMPFYACGMCGIGNDRVVFAAQGDSGIFMYNIETKELKKLLSVKTNPENLVPIWIGVSEDEKRAIVGFVAGFEREFYHSIPVDTDITYTFENAPKALKEDVEHIKGIYKNMCGGWDHPFPYGERKGRVIERRYLKTHKGLWGLIDRSKRLDLVLVKEKNEK